MKRSGLPSLHWQRCNPHPNEFVVEVACSACGVQTASTAGGSWFSPHLPTCGHLGKFPPNIRITGPLKPALPPAYSKPPSELAVVGEATSPD